MTAEIPGPRGYPFIGNLLDLQDPEGVPLHAAERLIDIYGPIVKFTIAGNQAIIVGGFELFDELCDETRFYKLLGGKLAEASKSAQARGLFTASTEKDEDWGQAHRILMPAFGPLAMEEMFNEMHDIATQMVLKWARQGSEHRISVNNDFSRLTLDTIALCAMDYRFNSFYQEEMHPFVVAMNNVLHDRSSSDQLGGMLKRLMPSYIEQVRKDVEFQRQVSRDLVQYRRDHPTEKKDLLNAMIYGKDPKTGGTMRDELIAANMQTFLVAGHETTSGLLSFAFVQLLKNPSTYFKAQQEVDRVIGNERVLPKHLNQLKYVNAVLRETLRLTPTAPGFGRAVRPENKEETPTIGNGRYAIPREKSILCLVGKIQRDPKVWGDDAAEFRPERMLDDQFEKLPKNAWKPFGTGMRACIGRAFAWQEALLAIALILQNFDLRLDDPGYELKVVQTLTIKPKDFYMRASLRQGRTATSLQHRLQASDPPSNLSRQEKHNEKTNGKSESSLLVLYGSNTGTCQALAQKLSAQALQRGLTAEVKDMDSVGGILPIRMPVIIITSSYEGLAPDNAARFVAWLESLNDVGSFSGVRYAVFGCGHSDWISTYQKIPTIVDDLLAKAGGTRVAERGASDVSKRDVFGDFDLWIEQELWPGLTDHIDGERANLLTSTEAITSVELQFSSEERASRLQQNVQWANVLDARVLTAEGQPEKRHLEVELPSGMSYSAGDYLAVLPLNPEESVRRVMKYFQLHSDIVVTLTKAGSTTLPVDTPMRVSDLLTGYVELSMPATRKDLGVLAGMATIEVEQDSLRTLAKPDFFETEILDKRVSTLDLLEKYSSIEITFANFLTLLPQMRTRHYSISSSPLASPTSCTLTYTVIDEPSWSMDGRRFMGVTGSYMRSLKIGDQVPVSVRSTNKYFRLPIDQEKTPIVMICAGSGIAPFRAFIQERATLTKEGRRKLAPAILFVGCRDPEVDRLYGDEIDEWAGSGVLDVRYAFSQSPEKSEGCRYVQDRMMTDKEVVSTFWDAGAKFYVCGAKQLASGVGKAARKMIREGALARGKPVSEEEVEAFVVGMRNERFVTDIF